MNNLIREICLNHIVIISLIPALISIILAFKFKNVFISLGAGLYLGIVVDLFIKGSGLLLSLVLGVIDFPIYLTNSLGDPSNSGIVMQVLFISGLVYLLSYTGGLKALANSIVKYANTREKTQFMTWVMGLIIFFDDYANSLIVGPVMRNVTDKARISREKLAFIIDATAAPIAGLVIISTWIGYEIKLISEQLQVIGVDAGPMGIFLNSIPFRFYNILMLIFIVLTIYMKREFGPMYDAEVRAKKGEINSLDTDEEEFGKMESNEGYVAKAYEGFIPLLVLIISSFFFFYYSGAQAAPDKLLEITGISDYFVNIAIAFSNADTSVVLSQSAILAIIVTFIISGFRGAFKLSKGIDLVIDGAANLIPTVFVILLAWSLGTIMDVDHLNTGNNIANMLGDAIPYQIIPMIIFLISSIIAFATGSSYGTMGILFPLSIPLAYSANPDIAFLTLVVGAILTGTILGDHCSPISDTTLLSSAGAKVNHLDHVKTQIPYAMFIGFISTIGYLIAGCLIGLSVNMFIAVIGLYVVLIAGMYLGLRVIGKKVE